MKALPWLGLAVAACGEAELASMDMSWPGQCAPDAAPAPDEAWLAWTPRLDGAQIEFRIGELLASGTLDADGACRPTWVGAVEVDVDVDGVTARLDGVSRQDASSGTWTLDAGAASDAPFGCPVGSATHLRLRVDRFDGVDVGGLVAVCSTAADVDPPDEITVAPVLD